MNRADRTRAAIVTGHSRGLGAAVALELVSRDVAVMGIARSALGRATEDARAMEQVALDLSDRAAVDAWLATGALQRFLAGTQQALLVNNAGVLQPIGPLQTQDAALVWRAVSVNVGAALALSAAFARATTAAADRRILHVSSGAGRKPYAGWNVYCATKAALDHHARAVVLDRAPGLRVSSVAPGIIDTDMQAEIRAAPDDRFPDRERFIKMQREGALRRPADTARALVDFLLSDDFGTEPVSEIRY